MWVLAISDAPLAAIGAFLTGAGGFLLGVAAIRKAKLEQLEHDEKLEAEHDHLELP